MKQVILSKQITLRENISIKKYLQEVSQIQKPLTIEEEKKLCNQIKQGNKKAEKELIIRNLRFVISVAKQYQQSGASLEDLISEGNYGLIKAAHKYNADTGNKFISYAVWWIQQSILMYIGEKIRMIRIPPNKTNDLIRIKKLYNKLEQKLQREPTIEEIIDYSKKEIKNKPIKNKNIALLLSASKKTTSLDKPIKSDKKEESDLSIGDFIRQTDYPTPDEIFVKQDLKIEINRLLNKIPPRNKEILKHYYGLNNETPKTLEEISQIVGITSERVRQLKNASLLELKVIAKRKDIFKNN